jgi:hypothetical protein
MLFVVRKAVFMLEFLNMFVIKEVSLSMYEKSVHFWPNEVETIVFVCFLGLGELIGKLLL